MKHSKKIITIAALSLILADGAYASLKPPATATPTPTDLERVPSRKRGAFRTPTIHLAQSNEEPVTVEGTLDSSSRQIEAGNYINIHTFEGTEGEIVQITANGEIQPYLSILDPNRDSILRVQSQADRSTFLVLPQTGAYEIGVIAPEVDQTGSYQLTWQVVSPDEVSIEPFEVEDELNEQSLKLDDNSLINIYPLFGVAGEAITIELTANDFEPILSVQDPSRNLIQSQQVSGSRASLTFSFPTTGNYLVGVISPEPDQTGSYQLNWEQASPEDFTIQPQSFEDQIDDESSQSEAGVLFNAYQFEAGAGQTISIELTSTTDNFTPVLFLVDPDGNLLTSSPVNETQTQITETLSTTGTYTIFVATPEPDQTGSYQLNWEQASEVEE